MAKNLKRQQRFYVLLSFPNKKSKMEIIRASRRQEVRKVRKTLIEIQKLSKQFISNCF